MSVRPAIPRRFSALSIQVCVIVCFAVFVLTPASAAKKKTLYAFGSRYGAHPLGTLVFDGAGNLYGTTERGGILTCGPDGSGGCGTVFQLAPQPDGTWKLHVLYEFTGGADGALPYTGVIFDAAGNLYGTTAAGGYVGNGGFGYGTAFELSPGADGWTETILHTFAAQPGDGQYPAAPLVFDKRGNLYGTTYIGRTPCDDGTAFELSPNSNGGWTENQLYCFTGADSGGMNPQAGLIFDEAGNLYSTTYLGGAYQDGTVFQLTPSGGSWTENILHDFAVAQAGATNQASLISDKNENLYGVTSSTVFELTPSQGGWTYTTLYEAQGGPHGIGPNSLIMDQAGNLYGTGEGGGSSNCHGGGCGAVFKLTHGKKGRHQTVVYSFKGGADGSDPYGGLVMDQQGNLYGTTYDGGRNCEGGCGTIFKITP